MNFSLESRQCYFVHRHNFYTGILPTILRVLIFFPSVDYLSSLIHLVMFLYHSLFSFLKFLFLLLLLLQIQILQLIQFSSSLFLTFFLSFFVSLLLLFLSFFFLFLTLFIFLSFFFIFLSCLLLFLHSIPHLRLFVCF